MPVTASAEKKMRKDKKRTVLNKKRKEEVKRLIRQLKKDHKKETLRQAQSAILKLAKVKVIHKNKASRMVSQLFGFAKAEKPVKGAEKKKVAAKTSKKTKNK